MHVRESLSHTLDAHLETLGCGPRSNMPIHAPEVTWVPSTHMLLSPGQKGELDESSVTRTEITSMMEEVHRYVADYHFWSRLGNC
jgi:hypothetical protein